MQRESKTPLWENDNLEDALCTRHTLLTKQWLLRRSVKNQLGSFFYAWGERTHQQTYNSSSGAKVWNWYNNYVEQYNNLSEWTKGFCTGGIITLEVSEHWNCNINSLFSNDYVITKLRVEHVIQLQVYSIPPRQNRTLYLLRLFDLNHWFKSRFKSKQWKQSSD